MLQLKHNATAQRYLLQKCLSEAHPSDQSENFNYFSFISKFWNSHIYNHGAEGL